MSIHEVQVLGIGVKHARNLEENTTRHLEEQLPEDEASADTQPTTNLTTGTRNEFSKPILEGLLKLILEDWEEKPLRCLLEEDLPGDKGDTTSEDFEPNKILKCLQTPFSMHKNPLYTKTSAMAMQEKPSVVGGHPEGSKPQQPFEANSSYLNARNSIGSPTPRANPNPFNTFSGVNPGIPNFGYGWNGGFHYTPYPILGYQLNNMMQYSMPGNTFGFGGLFSTPFPNNKTPCMPNFNNIYGGRDNTNNNGNNGNGGSRSKNSGHNGNGGNNNGGNNNNGCNLNGSNVQNGPSVFHFPDTSLKHLKYEGYIDPSEHLALFLNNVEQRGI
eukprot:Gb_34553 [translate_table: standard]